MGVCLQDSSVPWTPGRNSGGQPAPCLLICNYLTVAHSLHALSLPPPSCPFQTFDPHVVIQAHSNGTCVKVFETSSRVFKELGAKPRGNTQAVLVAAAFSGEPRDFYLGVVHAEVNRAYQNFFYKMQVGGGQGRPRG